MADHGEELIKYITQRVVRRINSTKSERIQIRKGLRSSRESWASHWFGLIPASIQLLYQDGREMMARRRHKS